jgi:hypothetical protein
MSGVGFTSSTPLMLSTFSAKAEERLGRDGRGA